MAPYSLRVLASKLNAHLKRLEAARTSGFDHAGAYYLGGARVRITYVSRQGGTTLSRAKAESYLAHLDGGFVGRHTALMPEAIVKNQILDGRK